MERSGKEVYDQGLDDLWWSGFLFAYCDVSVRKPPVREVVPFLPLALLRT